MRERDIRKQLYGDVKAHGYGDHREGFEEYRMIGGKEITGFRSPQEVGGPKDYNTNVLDNPEPGDPNWGMNRNIPNPGLITPNTGPGTY